LAVAARFQDDDGDEEEIFGSAETNNPSVVAAQVGA
jgi:hypothetical protein